MWDAHHCKNAVTREGVMAPRTNSTEASMPKKAAPDEPQFEDTLRCLLTVGPSLPPD